VNTLSPWVGRLLHRAGRFVSYCGVQVVALLPRNWWYPVLWRISRAQAVFIWPFLQFTSYRFDNRRCVPVVWMLNHWIYRLATAKGPFPIPIRIKGSEVIHSLYRNPTGGVLCSAHVPLLDLCLHSLIELGCPPAAVIGDSELESSFPVWGRLALPGIRSGQAVLLKVRTVLRNGGYVAALVDLNWTKTYSPNLFRVVQLAGAQAVFVIPELRPNGDIDIEFFLPPDPWCQTEQSIGENLEMLQSRVDRLLRRTPQAEDRIRAATARSVARDPPVRPRWAGSRFNEPAAFVPSDPARQAAKFTPCAPRNRRGASQQTRQAIRHWISPNTRRQL